MKKTQDVRIIYNENRKKTGVIMDVKNFNRLMESLEDLRDVYVVCQRTQRPQKTIPFEKVLEKLAKKNARK